MKMTIESELRYKESNFSKRWASTLKEAIVKTEQEIKDYKRKIEAEKKKRYKENHFKIHARDGSIETLGELNEKRRKGRIKAYEFALQEVRKTLDLLLCIRG